MTYPAYSYLSPPALEAVLRLARELQQAAIDVGHLTDGGGSAAYDYFGGGGRNEDKTIAVEDWIGPHRDTFERLFANESASAGQTRARLMDEAEAWAAFWATATNARSRRLYDEALDRYHRGMANHPPPAPPPVPVPTSTTGFAPTG